MAASTKRIIAQRSYGSQLKRLFTDPGFPLPAMIVLFVAEILVNILVILKIKYTEIDWIAYMQEVEGVVNGTYDYMQLKGDTGPLVYPAGFVYIFLGLYYITGLGSNIRLAQYIFAVIYLLNLLVVFDIYRQVKKIPPFVFLFMCALSYRIHSIYVLRLFNDPLAMFFLYIAVNLFLRGHWSWGCLFYSLGVSIKMNLLLFAPGLLLLLLATQGIWGTIKHLTICATPQILLAVPFLLVNPVGYIVRSFDLSRQFMYVWTVNWRLVPEEIFNNRYFHVTLLLSHLLVLLIFCLYRWRIYLPDFKLQWRSGGLRQKLAPDHIIRDVVSELHWNVFQSFTSLSVLCMVLPQSSLLSLVDTISSCSQKIQTRCRGCAIVLLPTSSSIFTIMHVFLMSMLRKIETGWARRQWLESLVRVLLLGLIEFCWNIYPSTVTSSSLLHVCHAAVLLGLWLHRPHSSSPPPQSGGTQTTTGKVKIR